jgi:hypothetical protein
LMDTAITISPSSDNLRPPVRVLRVDQDGTSRDVSDEAFRMRFPECS